MAARREKLSAIRNILIYVRTKFFCYQKNATHFVLFESLFLSDFIKRGVDA